LTTVLTTAGLRTQEPIHSIRSFLLQRWRYVAIEVERDPDLRMAQHVSNDLWVLSLSKQEASGGMAKVMEADPRYAGALQQWRE
jgi:hypothetical protein